MPEKSNKRPSRKQKTRQSAKKDQNKQALAGEDIIVAGVGASAGGLEALEEFFSNMPKDTNMAFCVVQHLSPDYKSLMGELLSRHTDLTIYRVEDGMQVSPNSIYLIPPKKNMTIFHDHLYLIDQDHSQGLNLPIDIFLRSLAEDKGKNAIGIILSGTGSDGTLGIRAIKESGGMVMVQEQQTAKFDGMPRSSIATGVVDYILPPDKMPDELVKYIKHPYIAKKQKIENTISKDEDLLTKITKIIKDQIGTDFTYYKPNTIIRRIEKRMSINQITKIENYVSFLQQSPNEAHILYKELLIGVTQFFRDQDAFELLKNKGLPHIMEDKKPGSNLRIWTVGCSTGEEAYSIAILIREFMAEKDLYFDVKIFATDIDKEALEYAGTGIYPESIISDISPELLKKYFTKVDKGYHVNENVRRMVIFATHNIISDPPFTKLDMISCRNLLIYLNNSIQKKIMSMFYFSLANNGLLFLGASESVGDLTRGFDPISTKWKLYKYKQGYKPPVVANFIVPPVNLEKKKFLISDPNYTKNNFSRSFENIFEGLLEEYIPPCVILNVNFEIIHVFKDVNQFIRIQPGKLNFNILKMAKKELSVIISSMLHKAAKEDKPVYYKEVEIQNNGEKLLVNLNTRCFNDKQTNEKYYYVSFEKVDKTENNNLTGKLDMKSEYTDQYFELEKELQFTKENLQATIEEVETSNEELQSTNEELIAANEELQSTNEELQSVNEELYTVNSEYQNKIEELTQLNNDINNLLKNTNIGTLFLDTDLIIRKYTPILSKVFNIIDQDIGRPVGHITHNLKYRNLIRDIKDVLETLKTKEVEAEDKNNKTYIITITPYRTTENAVEGIVLTVVDISNRVAIEEKLKREQNLLMRLMENSPVAKTMVDRSGKIIYANKKALNVLGITKSTSLKRTYNSPKWEITDLKGNPIPDNKLPFSIIMKSKKEINDYRHNISDGNKTKTLSISGSPVYDPNKEVNGAVFSLVDITEKLKMESRIKREKELLQRVLDISQEGTLITDKSGNIVYSNAALEKIFGLKKDEILLRSYNDHAWKIRDKDGNPMDNKDLPFTKVLSTGKPIKDAVLIISGPRGKDRKIKINGTPVLDDDENAIGVVFSIKKTR